MSQVDTLRKWRDSSAEGANYSTAALVADKILSMTKETADAFAFGKILFDQRNYLRAAYILKRPEFISDIKCRRLAVRCFIAAEKFDDAHELVLDTDSELAYLQGQIWSSKNSFDKAKASYLRAIKLNSNCFEAYDLLIRHKLLTQAEERQVAQELDFSAMDNCSDLVKSLYLGRLGSSVAVLDLVSDALTHLVDVYDLEENSDVLINKVNLLLTESKFGECRQLCEKVIKQDPYNYDIYPAYICALFELGDTNALFKVGHKLAEEAPNQAVAWISIGTYYMQIDNPGEARRNFSKATIIDPLCATAWLGFAHTFANEGEHERAITAYATASRLFPGSHYPFMFLGMQYLHLNNLNLAEEYLKKSGEMCNMCDPLVLNELAVLNYHRDALLPAKHYIDRSLELAQDQSCDKKMLVSIKANLGYIYRRMGLFDKCLEIFHEVARISPCDANIWITLGVVHLDLDDKDEAITYFNKALGLKRADPVATEMLNRAMKDVDPIEKILARAHVMLD